jgi:hypothetical protein
MPADPSTAIARDLQIQQVNTHFDNTLWAAASSLAAGVFLVVLRWESPPQTALLWWLAALAGLVILRALPRLWTRPTVDDLAGQRRWLLRFRISFVVHGLIWGAGIMLPTSDPLQLGITLFMLVTVSTASFTINSYDLVSAVCFGLPAMSLAALRLFTMGERIYTVLGMVTLLSLFFVSMATRRSHALVRQYVHLRQR